MRLLTIFRPLATTAVQILNQPLIKNGVKDLSGIITSIFGLMACADIYREFKNPAKGKRHKNKDGWIQTAKQIVTFCNKASLLLCAITTRPAQFAANFVTKSLFSPSQLERLFGPNTTFVVNPRHPRHPRHVLSIAAVVLALPVLSKWEWKGCTGPIERFVRLKGISLRNQGRSIKKKKMDYS